HHAASAGLGTLQSRLESVMSRAPPAGGYAVPDCKGVVSSNEARLSLERAFIAWLVRFGAPLLFFAQVFGIFGLPIPDELLLTIAGALVAAGRLEPFTPVGRVV